MAENSTVIQHVTKKSSDELLRKFAELEDDFTNSEAKKELKLSKRRKIRSKKMKTTRESGEHCYNYSISERPSHYTTLLLLPPVTRKSVLLRQLRATDFKNKSFFVAIEKTWRRTLEGATKILLEKHYNRHRRLISDAV